MRRAGPPRGKSSLVAVLSWGALVLGIGCTVWALMSIRAQSVQAASPTAFASKQVKSAGDAAVPAAASSLAIPDEPLYPELPAEGERIGSLSIPVLKQTLPIIEGTRTEDLKKGVGHFTQSVLPGEQDNCVISGHRDTVFTELGKVKVGDQLIAQTSAGTFTYEVTLIRIVDKDDRTVIVPTDHAVLTVSTCYPFRYVGAAPDRYVLVADLVDLQ
jgi:sortase A